MATTIYEAIRSSLIALLKGCWPAFDVFGEGIDKTQEAGRAELEDYIYLDIISSGNQPAGRGYTDRSILVDAALHTKGESNLEYRVHALLENPNPTAAIYCKTGECEIRITARAETDSSAEKMCRAYATKFYDLLGDAVYDEDVTGLEETLVHTLKEKGLTIATAESCTGGMIAQRLTNVSGASEVFGFGFVTYWEQAKAKMVGVEPAVIAKYNVVSAPVAAQMALGAAEAAGADIAVSVTGLAGPNGGDAVRPVGTVYLGAACGETVYVKKLFVSRPDRALVRARAAQAALELALRLAQGKVPADTQALAKSARHDAAALTALDSTFLKG